ncbi:polysialyltransferase family glycosyltransferase [Anoxybacillus geothermalis]|nr:polysialyltransferase family glycosyltransferase [Anoxybacillus geothermalis]
MLVKKRLFVCRSYYHIYCAVKCSDKFSQTTILCIDYQLDKKKLQRMKERIEKIFSNIKVIISTKSYKDVKSKLNNDYDEIYLFHWVVYKMPEMYIYMRFKNSIFYMIEDGVNHYGGIQKSIINKKIYLKYLINYLLIRRKDLVLKDNVKNIYVTYLDKYPEYMKEKLVLLETIFNKDINEELLDIFEINIPRIDNAKIAIVLTQPLSEDGFISESKKIEIYMETVNELVKKGYLVFFKSHPREKTKYSFSTDVVVLDKDFPAEILNFTGIKFNIAVAVSSGSLETINADYKIKLFPEFFDIVDYNTMNINVRDKLKNII